MQLLDLGWSNKEISDFLQIKPKNVNPIKVKWKLQQQKTM